MKIDVRDLVQGYGDTIVLDRVSFTLGLGLTVLIGVNGSGKTTLLRTLVGDLLPRSGTIGDLSSIEPGGPDSGIFGFLNLGHRKRLFRHGYVPQDAALPKFMTTHDVVAYAAWLKCVPRRDVPAAVRTALDRVGLMDRLHDKTGSLSGGMQRRLALAAAIVHEPQLLILDEPTVGLDPAQRIALRELLTAMAQERSILISTHILADAHHLKARLLVLADKKIAFDGTVQELEAFADEDQLGDSKLEKGFLAVSAQASLSASEVL